MNAALQKEQWMTREKSIVSAFVAKQKNHEMYAKFKEYHKAFMDKDKLVQLFHGWDTNAVKSFNKLLTKFLPKDRTYCTTQLRTRQESMWPWAYKVSDTNNSINAFSN
jgi:uncharacterized phage-associated protein